MIQRPPSGYHSIGANAVSLIVVGTVCCGDRVRCNPAGVLQLFTRSRAKQLDGCDEKSSQRSPASAPERRHTYRDGAHSADEVERAARRPCPEGELEMPSASRRTGRTTRKPAEGFLRTAKRGSLPEVGGRGIAKTGLSAGLSDFPGVICQGQRMVHRPGSGQEIRGTHRRTGPLSWPKTILHSGSYFRG